MKNKKFKLLLGTTVLCTSLMTQILVVSGEGNTTSNKARYELKNRKTQEKLEFICQKVGNEIKNILAEKIKVVEEKKYIAKQKANKEIANQVTKEESYIPTDSTSDWNVSEDVNTGASQSGREKGQRNQEYGKQLSDPNLSQDQRQQIIQEKKNYNRGGR